MDKSQINALLRKKNGKQIFEGLGLLKENGTLMVARGLAKDFGPADSKFMFWRVSGSKYVPTAKALAYYFDENNEKRTQLMELVFQKVNDYGEDAVIRLLGERPIVFDNTSNDFCRWFDFPTEFIEDIVEWYITMQPFTKSEVLYMISDAKKDGMIFKDFFEKLIEQYDIDDIPYLKERVDEINKEIKGDGRYEVEVYNEEE